MAGNGIALLVLPTTVGAPFNRPAYAVPTTVIKQLNDRIEGDAEITRLQEESLDPYVETRTLCLEKRQREIDALKGRSNDVAAIPATETVRETGTSVNSERSEEHTSELQSLMRISYAVFCLKK